MQKEATLGQAQYIAEGGIFFVRRGTVLIGH